MPSSLDIRGRSFFGALDMQGRPSGALRIEEAVSIRDYLFLRRLRNQVRHLMTRDTRPVSLFRQFRFFCAMRFGVPPAGLRIFMARLDSRPVGYLLVRAAGEAGEAVAITEAVSPEFRQRGIGRALIAFAKARYPQIVAEIREDNQASIGLHVAMGFEREGSRDGIAVYRFPR
jgi:ribosomal protein S18 acetylase RimI-like enzyme